MKRYLNESSSAASRVRIALALKSMTPTTQSVGIFGQDAESRQADFRDINPQGLVPALITDDGVLITQSMAIIEYLDELQANPPLLPAKINKRAFARSIALAIAAETHALLPPRIGLYLSAMFHANQEAILEWNRHWITEGFDAGETLLSANRATTFAVSDTPCIADIFLFPQAIGAQRIGLDLSRWPNIAEIVSRLQDVPAFSENAPAPRK